MRITCPSCAAVVAARDINLDRMLAKCERCDSVFDVSARIERASGGPALARARRLVGMPRNIRVIAEERDDDIATYRDRVAAPPRIAIERRWFAATYVMMAFFCVAWDSFLVFWYGTLLHAKGGAPWIAIVFPIAHVAVGVGLTYSTICGFVNRTRIAAVDGVLSVRHGPLPWKGNRAIRLAELDQLFCQEHVGSKGARSYSLNALLRSGTRVALLRGLDDPEQALLIEQALEKELGIVDVAVAGEYV